MLIDDSHAVADEGKENLPLPEMYILEHYAPIQTDHGGHNECVSHEIDIDTIAGHRLNLQLLVIPRISFHYRL